jgi:putative DNA methylase
MQAKSMAKRRPKTSALKDARTPPLIQSDEFPFEFLSSVAERESWRKEVYRPVYHIHKWWAKRLGSVFRGIILGCLLPHDADFQTAFYESHDFSGATVFDPFLGSGTTVGEAHKLGCTALGRDINPVACESVRVALGPLDRKQLTIAFEQLSETVGPRIGNLYRSPDDKGRPRDVLYFFWVKQAVCPHCESAVDLFPTRIFARNAYPDRKPEVQVCCPQCGEIFAGHNGDEQTSCPSCELAFNPHQGTATGTKAMCPFCERDFGIAAAVRAKEGPPAHRLYAKLLLFPDGTKRYLPATEVDHRACRECSRLLEAEVDRGAIRLPTTTLSDGYNTRQAIGYNYRRWRDFFNDRQLLALGWLQEAISELPGLSCRDALFALFSGVLEFNNLFASYKGEGTGAVRHMFSHHILKPERMPIEANVWGTPKSSGSFRNLFSSRLLRAIEYRDAPFEVKLRGEGKAYTGRETFSGRIAPQWPTEGRLEPKAIYLSCGSSDQTGLADQSIDLVVTDPPFFDNVHYSELADFFHAWQCLYPRGFVAATATTRHPHEVQDTEADQFAAKLGRVFAECHRVLKDDGLLVFTYHHSRPEGWSSLAQAIYGAGFSVVQTHPVKAEMSVATPKSQAKEPIQLDVIFVCQKREQDHRNTPEPMQALDQTTTLAQDKLSRLRGLGLTLSQNDCRVTVVSQFLAQLGPVPSPAAAVAAVTSCQDRLNSLATSAHRAGDDRASATASGRTERQLTLFSPPD